MYQWQKECVEALENLDWKNTEKKIWTY